jgi:hypothetical protein
MNRITMIFAALISVASINCLATEYKIQKVKTLGPMKHKVIFQSANLKKLKGTNILKGKLVAQWGIHVYEVVSGFYSCNRNNLCKLTDYERVATFEKCIVKSEVKIECRKRIGVSSPGNSSDVVVVDDGPDSIKDDMHRDRYNDEYSEFPVRIGGEYSDINF